jgi:hypothetical protein
MLNEIAKNNFQLFLRENPKNQTNAIVDFLTHGLKALCIHIAVKCYTNMNLDFAGVFVSILTI